MFLQVTLLLVTRWECINSGLDYWTGLLDWTGLNWTTGLTFDLKITSKSGKIKE